jgi:hypothetical protein
MKNLLLIAFGAVAFVFASVASNVITKEIKETPETKEAPKSSDTKKEETPVVRPKSEPAPQRGPGNLDEYPVYPPIEYQIILPPPVQTGPGNL